MSDEELAEAGFNRSQTHVDFMVGSDKMDIDGIRKTVLQYRFSEMEIGLEYNLVSTHKKNIYKEWDNSQKKI